MPSNTADPRTYVRQVPLPIPSHRGIKIQARCESVYNPSIPERQDVRAENYARRNIQLSRQGFRAADNEPYQGIGDPFYLDPKELILHALGQANSGVNHSSDVSAARVTSGNDEHRRSSVRKESNGPFSDQFRTLGRSRDFKNLNKAIVHGRNTIFRVRLGHDFFRIVKKEINTKDTMARSEMQHAQELLRTQPRPPKFELSSSEEEDESDVEHLTEEVVTESKISDLENSRNNERENSDGPNGASTKKPRARTAVHRAVSPRPYTPLYSNIATEASKHADSEYIECEDDLMTKNEKSRAENQWRRLIAAPATKNSHKTAGAARFGAPPTPSRISRAVHDSAHDCTAAASVGDVTSVAGSSVAQLDELDVTSACDVSVRTHDNESSRSASSLQAMPQLYPTTARDDSSRDRDRSPSLLSTQGVTKTPRSPKLRDSSLDPGNELELKRISEHTRFINSSLGSSTTERRNDRLYGQRTLYRPASSPALVRSIAARLPSNKWQVMPDKMKSDFVSTIREEEMALRDKIDSLDRGRLTKLEQKFAQIPVNMTINAALKKIRRKQRIEAQMHRAQRKPELYYQWFLDLINSTTNHVRETWYFQKVLDKLGHYGLVENGKQSAYKFNRVLAGLRDWEICAPDVSAAAEFCREKVVGQSVEDYEKWFRATFPSVPRPPLSTEQMDPAAKWVGFALGSVKSGRAIRSAPPKLRQTSTSMIDV